jgi:hypothetical protein
MSTNLPTGDDTTALTVNAEELRAGALEVMCYLLAAARGVFYEARLYAPYRLADGARRLIRFLDEAGVTDPEWRAIAAEIEEHAMTIITDEEAGAELIDELVLRLTAQLKDS